MRALSAIACSICLVRQLFLGRRQWPRRRLYAAPGCCFGGEAVPPGVRRWARRQNVTTEIAAWRRSCDAFAMKLTVVGTSYVGLVTAACLADFGNTVVCVSLDAGRTERLARGEVDSHEPRLAELIQANIEAKRIQFSDDLEGSLQGAEVVFLAIAVEPRDDGGVELSRLFSVADRIGKALEGPTIVATRSTVPVGTTSRLATRIGAHSEHPVTVVSNPAFIKVGNAIYDFLNPPRIVIGSGCTEAQAMMRRLYAPCVANGGRFVFTDARSAELAKYASSALLASRLSFMNELALLAGELGADIEPIRQIMGADPRIGSQYLFVGPGFGGTEFTSDLRMLLRAGQEAGRELLLADATYRVNERQKGLLCDRVESELGHLDAKTVAVWGIAFKPKTSDVGQSPAIRLILSLLERGASVRIHDPRALAKARAILGDRVHYAETMYEAAEGADALVLVTEWNLYRQPDFGRVKQAMSGVLLLDGRNLWDAARLRELGFRYHGIGHGRRV